MTVAVSTLARTSPLVRVDDDRHERRRSVLQERRRLDRIAVRGFAEALHDVQSRAAQVPVAGLMTKPDGVKAPPFWAMYVGVPKLEDAVAHIKRLGGSELSPVIDVPTVGRMQMMKDPQGAAFYIYRARAAASTRPRRRRSGRGVVARADDDRRAGRDEVLPATSSAGSRARRWTWGRWASTRCSTGRTG